VLDALSYNDSPAVTDSHTSTTVEIITLNTHLFGKKPFAPKWLDAERAAGIAGFLKNLTPQPDAVGFQEIWDAGLFWGEGKKQGIFARSGYAHGEHGDQKKKLLNSGLALMSASPLLNFAQAKWKDCDGLDCLAAKGWVQATIVKDGFSIGLLNLHAQADEGRDKVWTRLRQFTQLQKAVTEYRRKHPSHVVFVMGDFNVYGGTEEYTTVLRPSMKRAGAHDSVPNTSGTENLEQWTACVCNPLAIYFDEKMTTNGRLDYIFYIPSLDNRIEVIPLSVSVVPFLGHTLTENGLTTHQLSDHWSVYGRFQLRKILFTESYETHEKD
jgi:endonuclease/exonuclease/phosphatase family metal-dependent hydrolase